MRIIYDENAIKRLMFDLSAVTGLSFSFVDVNETFKLICTNDKADDEFCHKINATEIGKEKCKCSDIELVELCRKEGKPVSHLCHAGICDTAVPIKKNGITVGMIIIGRVRINESSDEVIDRLDWLNADKDEIKRRYERLSYFPKEKLNSLINLISNLLVDFAIRIERNGDIDTALEYIEQNLDKNLSVNIICQKCFVSKNKLYREFRNTLNCTVNDYIANKRIEKAKEFLRYSDETSREISEKVGITNYTYFYKLFKRRVGMTPNEYKKASNP